MSQDSGPTSSCIVSLGCSEGKGGEHWLATPKGGGSDLLPLKPEHVQFSREWSVGWLDWVRTGHRPSGFTEAGTPADACLPFVVILSPSPSPPRFIDAANSPPQPSATANLEFLLFLLCCLFNAQKLIMHIKNRSLETGLQRFPCFPLFYPEDSLSCPSLSLPASPSLSSCRLRGTVGGEQSGVPPVSPFSLSWLESRSSTNGLSPQKSKVLEFRNPPGFWDA